MNKLPKVIASTCYIILVLFHCMPALANSSLPAGVGVRMDLSYNPTNLTVSSPTGQSVSGYNMLKNPYVDYIMLMVPWSSIEPTSGGFDFSALDSRVAEYGQAGKPVIIGIVPYGQTPGTYTLRNGTPIEKNVPHWLLDGSDPAVTNVTAITFAAGGNAGGTTIAIPQVWKPATKKYPSFAQKYMLPMIQKLIAHYGGNQYVGGFKISCGHLGHIMAQPSTGGTTAFLALDSNFYSHWDKYCLQLGNFYQTSNSKPLMIMTEHGLLHDGLGLTTEQEIIGSLAHSGVNIFNDELALNTASDTPAGAVQQAESDISAAMPYVGQIKYGIGDDWPMDDYNSSSNYYASVNPKNEIYFQTAVTEDIFGSTNPLLPANPKQTNMILQAIELEQADPNCTLRSSDANLVTTSLSQARAQMLNANK